LGRPHAPADHPRAPGHPGGRRRTRRALGRPGAMDRPGRVLDRARRPLGRVPRLIARAEDSRILPASMSTTDISPVIGGEGWAIQRAGSFVLGVWNAPMTEERIQACRRLYRDAKLGYGRFSVFALFRTNPFPLELVANEGSRDAMVRLLDEFGDSFDVVVAIVDAKGFQASVIRMAAAAVTRVVGRGVPLVFP